MPTAGTAYVSIRGDFGPLNTGLRRSQGAFGNSLKDMESRSQRTFRRIGAFAKIGAVAGIAGIGIAARKAFSEFEESERATKQTEAVLKSTGGVAGVTADEVERLANALSLKSGKDDEAIQSAQNLLLTFTSVRNEVGKGNDIFSQATSVIADMSAALGQDFKASTIQVGKALQDPIKGITALRRVGVNFNATQTETVKKMVESGNLLGAQKFILRELRTEFEGSAEAQATASDKMRVAINNLLESFGKAFGPALSEAFQGLANFITQMQTGEGVGGKFADAIRGVGTAIKDTFSGIGDVFGAIFGGDTSGLDDAEGKVSGLKRALEDIGRIVAPVLGAMKQIGLAFGQAFKGVDQDLAAIARGLLAIGHAVATVLGPVVERILPGIVTAFKGLAQIIRGAVQVIAGILTLDFSRAMKGVENIFGGSFKLIVGMFRAASAPLREAAARIGKAISGAFSGLWNGIKALFRTGLRATAEVLRGYLTVYRTAALALARAIMSAFNVLKELPGKVAGFVGKIPGAIRQVIGRAVNAGEAVGRAIIRGLTNALRGVGKAILGAIKGGLSGATIIPKIKVPVPFAPDPTIGPIKIPNFAKGGRLRERLALVGEEGFELAKLPGGKMQLLGQEGPEIRQLPVGTQVYSHPQTKQKLATLTQKVVQRLVPATFRPPESLTQQVRQETLGTKPGKGSLRPLLSRAAQALSAPRSLAKGGVVKEIEPSRVSQIVRTPDSKFVLIDKAGKAIQVESSAKAISPRITAPVIDLSAIESPKIRESVQGAVKRHREPGGDATAASRRTARTSQIAGVSVTPSEVSAITKKWGVNRAIASIGAAVEDKFPAMTIISGSRPGATTKGGSRSNHAIRAALDLGTGRNVSLNRRIGSWVRANFPSSLRGVSEGVLDIDHDPNPPDHADHVHVAALGSEAVAKVMEVGGDGKGVDKPKPFKHLSLGQYVTVAKRVGFPDPALAAAIFYAESMGKVNAVGDGGKSLGAAQIHTPSHPKYDHKKLRDDVFYNMRAALEISKKGKTFQPWTQYRNAAYKQFLRGAKAAPLPRGTSKAPTGSKYTDYLEMKMLESESTPSFRDDIRWVNRAMRYWRGVVKRNRRAGNFSRVSEGLRELKTLRETKKELRAPQEEVLEDAFELGGLSKIGTGPNAFNIAGLQGTLDQIELEKAQASLTIPADGDDSFSGLAKSLQDDIGAASKLVSIRESIHTLTQGFQMPDRAPRPTAANPFVPTKAQSKALAKTKSPQERIALVNRFIDESVKGPFIVGTIKQKIEAANDLATARSELKSLTDEAGQKEETPEAEVKEDTKAQDINAFLAGLRELFKDRSNIKNLLPAFAKGGISRLSLALVGEEGYELAKLPGGKKTIVGAEGPEVRQLPVGTRVYPHAETKRKIASATQKVFQRLVPAAIGQPEPLVQPIIQEALPSNLRSLRSSRFREMGIPAFASGGVVESPQQKADPSLAEAIKRLEKAVRDQEAGKAVKPVTQHLHFITPPEDQHIAQKSALWELEALT